MPDTPSPLDRLAATLTGPTTDPPLPDIWWGATGDAVAYAQERLAAHGLYDPDVGDDDGHFGVATESAVRAFQRSRGLNPSAVVDSATWRALRTARS